MKHIACSNEIQGMRIICQTGARWIDIPKEVALQLETSASMYVRESI